MLLFLLLRGVSVICLLVSLRSFCLRWSVLVFSSSFFSSFLRWTTWSVGSLLFAVPSLCSLSTSRSSGFFGSLWCSRCLFVFLVTSLLDNMVGLEFDVCCTFTSLFEHIALFRFLWRSVMFLLSYSFFLCHLLFLLVTSLLDNMVGQQSDVCRTYTLLFQHSRSSSFFCCLWCSRCLIHASCVISSSSFSSLLCWTT